MRVPVSGDADVVAARQAARELAARLGFSATDLTLIATAVSEIARNIVRFAGRGEIIVELLEEPRPGRPDRGPGRRARASRTSTGRCTTATAPTAASASGCPGRAG